MPELPDVTIYFQRFRALTLGQPCAACQTGGRILADRSLSRLLKDDWPRTLEDLRRPPGG